MIKYLLILVGTITPVLTTSPSLHPLFFHRMEISTLKNSTERPEYLVHFKIDKIGNDPSETIAFTAPVLHCIEGKESVFSKHINRDGYMVKALIYKENNVMKVKTSLIVHENDVVVYKACNDCALT